MDVPAEPNAIHLESRRAFAYLFPSLAILAGAVIFLERHQLGLKDTSAFLLVLLVAPLAFYFHRVFKHYGATVSDDGLTRYTLRKTAHLKWHEVERITRTDLMALGTRGLLLFGSVNGESLRVAIDSNMTNFQTALRAIEKHLHHHPDVEVVRELIRPRE